MSNLQDHDDRSVFDMIRRCSEEDAVALADHLERTKTHIDVTALFNSEGNTALTFAAQSSKHSACLALISFIRRRQNELALEVEGSISSSS